MSKGCNVLVVLGLLWTGLASGYLWHRDVNDQQLRTLRALAVSRLGASAEEYATNEIVRIPRGSVDIICDLAQTERERSFTFNAIAWISSGFIVVLALCLWNATGEKRTDDDEIRHHPERRPGQKGWHSGRHGGAPALT